MFDKLQFVAFVALIYLWILIFHARVSPHIKGEENDKLIKFIGRQRSRCTLEFCDNRLNAGLCISKQHADVLFVEERILNAGEP